MIWIVLACIFGIFIGKAIHDEGLDGLAQLLEVFFVQL